MKNFRNDLIVFLDKIKNGDVFSLSRYGDGELAIIRDESIDISKKFNGEHKYEKGNEEHQPYRKRLIDSLLYNHESYYIGIPCRCCVGDEKHEQLKNKYFNSKKQLTWANIFVNSNYSYFMDNIFSLLKHQEVYFIGHEKAKTSKLPINVKKHYKVSGNSWINNIDIIEDIKKDIESNKINSAVFLFAAGVLSNIAVKELHEFCPDNFYIDIGSTFDKILGLGKTRVYLKGGETLKKTCIW